MLGVLLALVVAEAVFWFRDGGAFPHLNCYAPDPDLAVRLRPGATQKVRFGSNPITRVRINSAGFRGGELPESGSDEVLVVGDSQVFGLGVEEDETFASVLSKELGGTTVVNAGVPTYGPPEYERLLDRLLQERKPKTVVYTVNFVNDAFEAQRENTQRHAIWDGWAVRKETLANPPRSFPGRSLLFRDSHLVFALRQWLYRQGPQRDDRGFASEGTWQDLVDTGGALQGDKARARNDQDRENALRETEARYRTRAALAAELRVKLLAYQQLGLDPQSNSVYLASDANPGDIVVPQMGEEGRALSATAKYVREAAALRNKIEKMLRERAAAAADDPRWKQVASSMAERDALEKKLAEVNTRPLTLVRAGYPLLREVEKAKEKTEQAGARFVLLVLPIDVQVSADEWKKYGKTPMDMEPTRVLLADLAHGISEQGASVLDATEVLKKTEPGAFLDGDPHLTPKGHAAVAAELARVIKAPPPKPVPEPRLALPPGRSRLPLAAEWAKWGQVALGRSDPARCVTKRIREWLYVRCHRDKPPDPDPTGAEVLEGGHGEVFISAVDHMVTMVAPILRGENLRVRFDWDREQRDLEISWPADTVEPDMAFSKERPGGASAKPPSAALSKICDCYKKLEKQTSCGGLPVDPSSECVETYGDDCSKLLECATGRALRMPQCPAGTVNAGAALHCFASCASGESCATGKCVDKQGAKLCVLAGSSEPAPQASARVPEVVAPQAPANAAEVRAFDAAARRSLDAIEVALKACDLLSNQPGDWFDLEIYDWCRFKPGTVPAVHAQVGEVAKLTKASPALLQGPRLTFVRQLQMFDEWVELASRAEQSRGTLLLYQELARAFGDYTKNPKVPLDPEHIVHQYFVQMKDPSDHYLSKFGPYKSRRARGLPLPWKRGVHGPRLPN